MEPQTAQPGASLPYRELKNRHAPSAEQPRVTHLTDDAGHFSRTQFRDPTRVQTVFIAKRKIMEQVADRANSLGGEHIGDPRPNAFHILNRGGKFEHAIVETRPPMVAGAYVSRPGIGAGSEHRSREFRSKPQGAPGCLKLQCS